MHMLAHDEKTVQSITTVPKKMRKHLALSKNHWLQWQVEPK